MLQPFGPSGMGPPTSSSDHHVRRIAVLNWESLSCRLPGARPNSSERNYTHRAWIVTLALFAVLLSTPLFVSDRAAEATTTGLSKLCTRSPRGKWPGPVFA